MVAAGVQQRSAQAAQERATAERIRSSFDANGNPLYPVDEPIAALNIERAPPLTIPNDLRTINDMMGGLSFSTVGAGSAGTDGNGGAPVGVLASAPVGSSTASVARGGSSNGGVDPIGDVLAASSLTITAPIRGDATALAAQSSSLLSDLKMLQQKGWGIQIGSNGGGSFANRTLKTIVLDGNLTSDPVAVVQALSHEAGHALYAFKPDTSSKSAFVRSALGDEGMATLSNIRVQREILARGGPDIGIAGGDPVKNSPAYNAAYNQFLKDGNVVKARDAIGSIFGSGERASTTGQLYKDYYGSFYDKHYPKPRR